MHLQLVMERAMNSAVAPILEHNEGLWLDQPIAVGRRHDRCLEHAGMLHEGSFHLEWRDPNGAHLEHVVGAPVVDVDAVRSPHIFVAGTRPLADEGPPGFFPLIPVAGSCRLPTHQKLADLAVADLAPILVDELEIVVVHWHAGGAVLDGVRQIRQIEMAHFGRAHSIDDVESETLLPRFSYMGWKRL